MEYAGHLRLAVAVAVAVIGEETGMGIVTQVDIPENVIYTDCDSPIRFDVYDDDGEPVDCSLFELLWQMRAEIDADTEDAAIISKSGPIGITVTGTDKNRVTVQLLEADLPGGSDGILQGWYYYMLRRNNSGSKRPIAAGRIYVTGSAARD